MKNKLCILLLVISIILFNNNVYAEEIKAYINVNVIAEVSQDFVGSIKYKFIDEKDNVYFVVLNESNHYKAQMQVLEKSKYKVEVTVNNLVDTERYYNVLATESYKTENKDCNISISVSKIEEVEEMFTTVAIDEPTRSEVPLGEENLEDEYYSNDSRSYKELLEICIYNISKYKEAENKNPNIKMFFNSSSAGINSLKAFLIEVGIVDEIDVEKLTDVDCEIYNFLYSDLKIQLRSKENETRFYEGLEDYNYILYTDCEYYGTKTVTDNMYNSLYDYWKIMRERSLSNIELYNFYKDLSIPYVADLYARLGAKNIEIPTTEQEQQVTSTNDNVKDETTEETTKPKDTDVAWDNVRSSLKSNIISILILIVLGGGIIVFFVIKRKKNER